MGLSYEECKKLGIEKYWPVEARGEGFKLPEAAPPPSQFVSDGMNKLERAFWERLQEAAYEHIKHEPFKLKLAGRTFYTPDFGASANKIWYLYEVKGFMRDDASVKIKVAAETFPEFRFILVTKPYKRWECRNVGCHGIEKTPYTPLWLR